MVMWLVAAVQQFFATIQTYHGALGKGQSFLWLPIPYEPESGALSDSRVKLGDRSHGLKTYEAFYRMIFKSLTFVFSLVVCL